MFFVNSVTAYCFSSAYILFVLWGVIFSDVDSKDIQSNSVKTGRFASKKVRGFRNGK